jgi:hypothetical protein
MKNLLRLTLLVVGTTMLLESYSNIGNTAPIDDIEYLLLKDAAQARYQRTKNLYQGRSPSVSNKQEQTNQH